MRPISLFLLFASILIVGACTPNRPYQVLKGKELSSPITWTERELQAPVSQRKISENEHASFHLIRLLGAEKPHIHNHHDLTVFILKGKAQMHFEEVVFSVKSGDVIEIPHGKIHWAANASAEICEAYVVFTPPSDASDYHEA